jgi:membrane protein YqaA with SNARE-associated domain
MSLAAAYLSLFLVSFLAATIVPAQSEAVLSAMLLSKDYQPWLLVLTASVGNTLGAVVNWALGRGIERFHDKKWFPVKDKDLAKAKVWYSRYGRWSLLLSWLPFVGDALTVVAGVMREKLAFFLALVAFAKTGRYVVIALAVL